MIMGRNLKFNIMYAQIVTPIEHAFFELPQVANACDYLECGEKFSKLTGGWFMENDFSKYESSQRKETLLWEYMLYSGVFPEKSELIDALFSAKLLKRGHTNDGTKFEFDYCRGSGDMDTSLGNGILNYIATQYFLVKNYCPGCKLGGCQKPGCCSYKFVLKGDDSYAGIPKTGVYENTYDYFGFDAKIIIKTTPEEVEFCSGRFVEYQPTKWMYVQKLQKLLDSLRTCINEAVVKNGWVAHYYYSLGMMYKKLYRGLPIYEDIADLLLTTNSPAGLNINLVQSWNLLSSFRSATDHDIACSENVLLNIAMANDMTIPEIMAIRDHCRTSFISFPPSLCKTSRLGQHKSELPSFSYEVINASMDVTTQSPRAVRIFGSMQRYGLRAGYLEEIH